VVVLVLEEDVTLVLGVVVWPLVVEVELVLAEDEDELLLLGGTVLEVDEDELVLGVDVLELEVELELEVDDVEDVTTALQSAGPGDTPLAGCFVDPAGMTIF
jgi:hypothetical protein